MDILGLKGQERKITGQKQRKILNVQIYLTVLNFIFTQNAFLITTLRVIDTAKLNTEQI